MFSFGCVLLEILVLHGRGSFDQLRMHLGADPSFYANVHHLGDRLKLSCDVSDRREYRLKCEIELMLSIDHGRRPWAREFPHSLTAYDLSRSEASMPSVFGDCCGSILLSKHGYEAILDTFDRKVAKMQNYVLHLEEKLEIEKSVELALEEKEGDQIDWL